MKLFTSIGLEEILHPVDPQAFLDQVLTALAMAAIPFTLEMPAKQYSDC